MAAMATFETSNRDRRVERVLWIEGFANFAVTLKHYARFKSEAKREALNQAGQRLQERMTR